MVFREGYVLLDSWTFLPLIRSQSVEHKQNSMVKAMGNAEETATRARCDC